MGSSRRPDRRLAAAMFGAGLAVCLLGSWRPSLWTDEAATISAAQRSLAELWAMVHNVDVVHAAYYLLMHGWLGIFPANAFFLRLPSALATGLTTLGAYWLGCRLASQWVAVCGALVLAILPRTTWMGMEARSYAISALLAVAATLLLVVLVTGLTTPRREFLGLAAYAVLAALGIAMNLYLALLLVAHGVSLLLDGRVAWRWRWRWLAASVLAVALSAPVVWAASHQTNQLGSAFGFLAGVRSVVVTQWFLGQTPTPTTDGGSNALDSLWKLAAVGLALVCWALVLGGVLARRRVGALLVWTLPWLAVPTATIVLYSALVHDIYNPRYFTFCTPAVGLLIGHGLALITRRWLLTAVVVAIIVGTAPVYVSQRTEYAKSSTDWSGVARFVAANRVEGTAQAVYFSPRYPITGPLVGQTARGVRTAYPEAFAGMPDVTLLRSPEQDDNLSGTSRRLQDSLAELSAVDTVWVVRRNDYAYIRTDDQTLARAGFQPGRQWRGPLDHVVEFTRR